MDFVEGGISTIFSKLTGCGHGGGKKMLIGKFLHEIDLKCLQKKFDYKKGHSKL